METDSSFCFTSGSWSSGGEGEGRGPPPPSHTLLRRRPSVPQDDLDKAGHVGVFGLVGGEEGMLLWRRETISEGGGGASANTGHSAPSSVILSALHKLRSLTMSSVYVGRSLETFFKLQKQK